MQLLMMEFFFTLLLEHFYIWTLVNSLSIIDKCLSPCFAKSDISIGFRTRQLDWWLYDWIAHNLRCHCDANSCFSIYGLVQNLMKVR